MAHRSTQMRRKMKEEEPEKYEEFLARNRERNKAKSAEKKAAWEQETHTRAQIEEQERKKKKKRARDRERYQRKKAEGTRQTRNSSIAGTCSSEGPPRKKLKDMSSGERRQYNSASRKRQRDAQSSQKKTAINAKRRADYKAKQEAEAQALNTSSEVNLPKPSSSRLRQSLYNLNHERKDEWIAHLETENAMLYLKLAQLRGDVKEARQEASQSVSGLESGIAFKANVKEKTSKLRSEIQAMKLELSKMRALAKDIPVQFAHSVHRAHSVMHHHQLALESHSSNVTALADQVAGLQQNLDDATDRLGREKKRRQELHNLLMELRGNIRVHGRLRPLMEFDADNEDASSLGRPGTRSEVVVHFVDDENICVQTSKHNKVFEYERVYSPTEKQESVFDEVQPMLTSLLDGYNVCIMAYGQTGSGKTHTMLGSHRDEDYNPSHDPHPDEGVIPRATRELFRLIEEKPEGSHCIEVSIVEVYNNDIRDLLSRDPNAKHDVVTGSDGQLSIPTVTSKSVDNVYSVMTLVQYGLRTRRESATLVHEHSSRSHLIVTLTVVSRAPSFFASKSLSSADLSNSVGSLGGPDGRQTPTLGKKGRAQSQTWTPDQLSGLQQQQQQPVIRTKLQLVDLAGSECVGMSGVKGAALREASFINKSLSALADVLGALAEHRTHVPYRNSRLTHFLQDSIGGDAKLLVLLCVSPAQRYISESLQCLGFGQRARQVQRGPTKRRLPSSAEKVSGPDNSGSNRPRTGSASK